VPVLGDEAYANATYPEVMLLKGGTLVSVSSDFASVPQVEQLAGQVIS
jgi:hypothetical protein